MKHSTPFLGRVHTLAFVFLCVGASILGGILFFLVAAFCLGFVEGLFDQGPQSIYQGPTLIFTLVGFILPVIVLFRRRRKSRRSPPILDDNSIKRDKISVNLDHDTNGKPPLQSPTMPIDQPASVSENEDIWHYADGGKRLGPVSAARIKSLLSSNQLDRHVLVWRKGMKDWAPIHETDLVDTVDDAAPPLPSHAVNNVVIWLLAFSPLIFAAIDQTMRQQKALQMLGGDVAALRSMLTGSGGSLAWYIPALSYFVLCVVDINLVYRAGYRAWYLGASALLFIPIYPFVRAGLVRQIPYYGFVFIVCAILESLA
jgi:hypothetical protein